MWKTSATNSGKLVPVCIENMNLDGLLVWFCIRQLHTYYRIPLDITVPRSARKKEDVEKNDQHIVILNFWAMSKIERLTISRCHLYRLFAFISLKPTWVYKHCFHPLNFKWPAHINIPSHLLGGWELDWEKQVSATPMLNLIKRIWQPYFHFFHLSLS